MAPDELMLSLFVPDLIPDVKPTALFHLAPARLFFNITNTVISLLIQTGHRLQQSGGLPRGCKAFGDVGANGQ